MDWGHQGRQREAQELEMLGGVPCLAEEGQNNGELKRSLCIPAEERYGVTIKPCDCGLANVCSACAVREPAELFAELTDTDHKKVECKACHRGVLYQENLMSTQTGDR